MISVRHYVLAFSGGFLSTLLFHQGLVGLFYAMGLAPMAPFNMTPTAPLGVPSVISLAFFGGLWGMLVWAFVRNAPERKKIIRSVAYGAIGPTAVAFLVVFPLKGVTVPLAFIPFGLVLNGAWGLGLWLFMKVAARGSQGQ